MMGKKMNLNVGDLDITVFKALYVLLEPVPRSQVAAAKVQLMEMTRQVNPWRKSLPKQTRRWNQSQL